MADEAVALSGPAAGRDLNVDAGENSDLDLDFLSDSEEEEDHEKEDKPNDALSGTASSGLVIEGSDESTRFSTIAGGNDAENLAVGIEEMRVAPTSTVFTKEKSLTVQSLVKIENPNYEKETPEQAAMREAAAAEKKLAQERAEEELLASGGTVEAAADLERLEEVKRLRARETRRREHEARKQEERRVAAAERAAELDAKIKAKLAGGGNKNKKKKGKKR